MSKLKRRLRILATAMAQGSTFATPHDETQKLAKQTLEERTQIRFHDLWSAACLLHPGYCQFPYVDVTSDIYTLTLGAKRIIWRTMSTLEAVEDTYLPGDEAEDESQMTTM